MAATSMPLTSLPSHHHISPPPSTTYPPINQHRYFANHPTILLINQSSNQNQLKQIHAQMLRTGLFHDPFSASTLISAFALSSLQDINYAHQLFDQMPQPNVYTWNALIRAYSSSQTPIQSLIIFTEMIHQEVSPNKFTYPFVIKAAAEVLDFKLGQVVHGMAIKTSFDSDVFILNSLIHFYASCGCLDSAYTVFLNIPVRDVVSWNSMITAFAQGGYSDDALKLFRRMQCEGLQPDNVTMMSVLTACTKKLDLGVGRLIHSVIERIGITKSVNLNNALLDMYVKCGKLDDAQKLFDKMAEKDIVSWTTMLVGYAKSGHYITARRHFESMPNQDIAAWNALISAYEQNGNPKEALSIFNELQVSNKAEPDDITLVSSLSACAQLGALDMGGWIHVYIEKHGVKLGCHLVTSLIDMYSKCGDLNKAREVFNGCDDSNKDVFVWSAMIAGFAMHGHGRDAINVFEKMRESNVKPNGVTFTNLLCGCSHAGLLEEGRDLFTKMKRIYGITPGVKHYACMVDMLGRAGRLEEALELINTMPMAPLASVYGALLGACKLYGNVEVAEHASVRLLELEPWNHGAYVLLSNVYAKSGKWDKVASLRKRMKDVGIKKEPGCSTIEVNGCVHEFVVGDSAHSQSKTIYRKLNEVFEKLKLNGYEPNRSQVLQCVEEEDMQEHALHLHSEKLAIAFGLVSLTKSQPIRVMKNLRVCGDCHNVAKLVSKVYDREILLRDRYRFHRFKAGECSCKDYW